MSSFDLEYLKKFILFSEMNENELSEVSKLINIKTYPEDYTLFFQNEEGSRVFFLKKGKIKVVKTTPDGSEQILEILKPGDVFGEVVLFGIDSYPATTRTMEETEVGFINRDEFREYFNKNPEIGWGMLKVMARKLSKAQHRIENLGLRNTKGRVARLIIDMIEDYGTNQEVILDVNQRELANFIGTSRETVSRTLSEFRKKGLLEINDNKLKIKNQKGLKKYL